MVSKWDDTVLQTQDSKFEPWRSEAEHATSRSQRLPTILTFTRGWGRNIFASLKPPRPGTEPRTLAWKAAVLTTTPGPPPNLILDGLGFSFEFPSRPLDIIPVVLLKQLVFIHLNNTWLSSAYSWWLISECFRIIGDNGVVNSVKIIDSSTELVRETPNFML